MAPPVLESKESTTQLLNHSGDGRARALAAVFALQPRQFPMTAALQRDKEITSVSGEHSGRNRTLMHYTRSIGHPLDDPGNLAFLSFASRWVSCLLSMNTNTSCHVWNLYLLWTMKPPFNRPQLVGHLPVPDRLVFGSYIDRSSNGWCRRNTFAH